MREVTHPQTPDMFAKCTTNVWNNRIKDWKQSLDDYASDDPWPQLKVEKKTAVTNQAQPNRQHQKVNPQQGKRL